MGLSLSSNVREFCTGSSSFESDEGITNVRTFAESLDPHDVPFEKRWNTSSSLVFVVFVAFSGSKMSSNPVEIWLLFEAIPVISMLYIMFTNCAKSCNTCIGTQSLLPRSKSAQNKPRTHAPAPITAAAALRCMFVTASTRHPSRCPHTACESG
jgi:hypothetical protein